MKKILIGIMLLCLMVLFGVSQALAQPPNEGTISVTVTIGVSIEIEVDPGTWPIGEVILGATAFTEGPAFTVINNSSVLIDLSIAAMDAVLPPPDSNGWFFDTDPGANTFAMDFIDPNMGPVQMGPGPNPFGQIAPTENQRFDLQFYAPLQTGAGEHEITVLVTAGPAA